jgi:predicted Rossmann fold nucleotide-binding protein DprA/Smf involved in DNA uptake
MTVSETTQAVLLLTGHFKKTDSGAAKPLAPKEYGRFAEWLHQRSLTPAHLLRGNPNDLLGGWQDKTVSIERVNALLDRGPALAISMEKWLRSGLWVMIRSDPDYPRRLKQRLKSDSPAILFGCGNRALLNRGGLAVVGSRKVNDGDLVYSSKLGALASNAGISIVSGGARGVDETAMLGALEAEGTAVGVLADSLLRACSGAKYRKYLLENNLVLVSSFNPEAGFNAGNAMQRNKYIYCIADAALAVHSGKTGGTWTGAKEDLKRGWVPLWVKPTDDPEAGNAALIAAGASQAPASIDGVEVAAFFRVNADQPKADRELFDQAAVVEEPQPPTEPATEADTGSRAQAQSEPKQVGDDSGPLPQLDVATSGTGPQAIDLARVTFYELFVAKAKELCGKEPRTTDELVQALALNKTQLNAWLKQAVERGELKKRSNPVRYEVDSVRQGAFALE